MIPARRAESIPFMFLNAREFHRKLIGLFSIVGVCLFSCIAHAAFWTTAYYPGWEQSYLPASKIDFTAVTHLIHFSVVPDANGTLNGSANSLTIANSADIVSHAHAAGVKVLVCV